MKPVVLQQYQFSNGMRRGIESEGLCLERNEKSRYVKEAWFKK